MSEVIELNIYQRMAKIRKPAEVLQKNRAAYGYSYTTDDEILSKITGLMEKYHVSLIPSIVPHSTVVTPYTTTENKTDKAGNTFQKITNEILIQSELLFRWVNDDNPSEFIEVPWTMVGQKDEASQAFGSGMTYCRRYFLLHYFNISTVNDDPDSWRSKQKEATDAENREIAKAIVAKIHASVTGYLAKNPKERDNVLKLVSKHASKGNYNMITDPEVAKALLADLVKNKISIDDAPEKE